MSNQEIFKSRDQLNKTIVETLSMYGNLEPPSRFGRPYNDGSKVKYQFSAANYLRMLAVQRKQFYPDPRWVSEDFIKKQGLSLIESAIPVEIEYWKGVNQGKSYTGELRKFYNVADLVDAPIAPKIIKGNQPEDIEYAVDLLKANDVHISYKDSIQKIFDTTVKYAKEKGADEFAAPLTAQLLLKTSHLALDYTKHRLFDEAQLNRLESNAKIIFAAMKKAQDLMNRLQYVQEQSLNKQAEIALAEQSMKRKMQDWQAATREPFKDLVIDFMWSEAALKNMAGKAYPNGVAQDNKEPDKGLQLKGKAAYEFLVQLNSADKDFHNDRLQGANPRYYKTKLAVQYGNYQHGVLRVDLGDLELGNKDSIAEALSSRLNSYRRRLIEDPAERELYLLAHKGENIDSSQLIKECKNEMAVCNTAMQELHKEESMYLAAHPELQTINKKKADTYLYCINEEDLFKLPPHLVLAQHSSKEYPGMVYVKERSFLPTEKNHIVFESASLITDKKQQQKYKIHPVVTKEGQQAVLDLNNLSVTVKNYGSVYAPLDKPVVHEYKGSAALKAFIDARNEDIALNQTMKDRWHREQMEEKGLVLAYKGQHGSEILYTNGSCGLARLRPIRGTNGLIPLGGYNGSDKDTVELSQAIYTMARQSGFGNNNIMRDLHASDELRTTYEERRKAVTAERPSARAVNSKHYEYYQALAAQNDNNNTPKKLMNAMLQEMKQDGLAPIKIANIAKTNKAFDRSLLSSKSVAGGQAEEKTPKEKLQEKVAQRQQKKALAI